MEMVVLTQMIIGTSLQAPAMIQEVTKLTTALTNASSHAEAAIQIRTWLDRVEASSVELGLMQG